MDIVSLIFSLLSFTDKLMSYYKRGGKTYSEPCQTSMMERFAKKRLTPFNH